MFGSGGRPAGGREDRREDDEDEHDHEQRRGGASGGADGCRLASVLIGRVDAARRPVCCVDSGRFRAVPSLTPYEQVFYSDPAPPPRRPRRRPSRRSGVGPCPRRPTPSSTATRASRSSTGPPPRRTSWSGPSSSACPASPSPTARASTASSASPSAAEEAGLHPVIGVEIELVDALVAGSRTGSWSRRAGRVDPAAGRQPRRRPRRSTRRPARTASRPGPQPARARLPGHREPVKEDLRGVGARERGPHLVLLARDGTGYRSLCRLVSRANLAGTKAAPRFTQALLAEHAEGLVALSGCRDGELARRLLAGDRDGRAGGRGGLRAAVRRGRRRARRPRRGRGRARRASPPPASSSSSRITSCPTTTGSSPRPRASPASSACRSSSRTTSTTPGPRTASSHDVLTAIRHGRTVETLADLRTPERRVVPEVGRRAGRPAAGRRARRRRPRRPAWAEGIANAGELAAACRVDLGFEQYRFPGFPVPAGETAFSYLAELCHGGVRRRYHPVTPAVVKQLAHELDVIERTGLAEFFLICWDLMRFAKERRIPAQGRGSAADSIVAYVLGITRVDPIRHNLLFERFINEGRTTYPDVDIDFSSERREEVIQYVYERYGAEHTGMVCNLVTYRARERRPRGRATRSASRGRSSTGWRRRSRRTTRSWSGATSRRTAGSPSSSGGPGRERAGRRRGARPRGRRTARPRGPATAGSSTGWASSTTPGAAGSGPAGRARPGTAGCRGPRTRRGSGAAGRRRGRDAPGRRTRPGGRGILPGTGSAPAIRAGGRSDDEGGPGDSPASVAWLVRGGPPTADGPAHDRSPVGHTVRAGRRARRTPGRRARSTAARSTPSRASSRRRARNVDRLGRPRHCDPPPAGVTAPRGGTAAPPLVRRPRRARAAARRRAAGAPSGCRPGSAGSSCAPGSTASRATSRSTPAGCS